MGEKFIGVDIGGSSTRAALVSNKGKVLKFFSTETNAKGKRKEVLENICSAISAVFPKKEKIKAIGIGCPGAVDSEKGKILYNNTIPSLSNFGLRKFIQKKFKAKTFCSNDAAVNIFGEALIGAGKKFNKVVGITLGTGIGSGIVLDKKIYIGANGITPHFGHMTINPLGPRCSCEKYGCWEEFVSIRAILKRAEWAIENKKTIMKKMWPLASEKVDIAARKGDKEAIAIMKETAYYLGIGLANIANGLMPDAIIIGGGLSNSRILLKEGEKEMKKRLFYPKVKTKVLKGRLGNKAGAIGAALFALEKSKRK